MTTFERQNLAPGTIVRATIYGRCVTAAILQYHGCGTADVEVLDTSYEGHCYRVSGLPLADIDD